MSNPKTSRHNAAVPAYNADDFVTIDAPDIAPVIASQCAADNNAIQSVAAYCRAHNMNAKTARAKLRRHKIAHDKKWVLTPVIIQLINPITA